MSRKDLIFFSACLVWAVAILWSRSDMVNLAFIAGFAVLTLFKVRSRRFAAWLETPLLP